MIGNLGGADNHAIAMDRISIETRQGRRRTVCGAIFSRAVEGMFMVGVAAPGRWTRAAPRCAPLEGGRIVTTSVGLVCKRHEPPGPSTLTSSVAAPSGICHGLKMHGSGANQNKMHQFGCGLLTPCHAKAHRLHRSGLFFAGFFANLWAPPTAGVTNVVLLLAAGPCRSRVTSRRHADALPSVGRWWIVLPMSPRRRPSDD